MNPDEFRRTLGDPEPPPGISVPLAALWHAAKGDWDRAHGIVQDAADADGSWVHAHLHRIEGDLANAAIWYRRAGKPVCADTLDGEWDAMAAVLLAAWAAGVGAGALSAREPAGRACGPTAGGR